MKSPLTLVEGEGSVVIIEREGYVDRVFYEITEAPRFFEYIVRGKSPELVVDFVSRVCGICGVSYTFLAAKAFEKCLNIEVDSDVEEFREILHLAERVKSHALHVFLMNLPEITKTRSFSELAERNPKVVKNAFNIISYSRKLMRVFGGRFHNVVNIKIGGVYFTPSRDDVEKLRNEINGIFKSFTELADIILSFKSSIHLAISKPQLCVYAEKSYSHHGEKVVLDNAIYTTEAFYRNIVSVVQKEYSTALQYRVKGSESFIVGPVSRFNRYYDRLHSEVKDLLNTYDWRPPLSVFEGYIARIAELYDALLTIREYLENYKYRDIISVKNTVEYKSANNVCEYAVEAPRGVLYHRYVLGKDCKIVECDIVTPTAQNLAVMEDIATQLTRGKRALEETIAIAKSVAIAFDPCISCSVHTLPVKVFNFNKRS